MSGIAEQMSPKGLLIYIVIGVHHSKKHIYIAHYNLTQCLVSPFPNVQWSR